METAQSTNGLAITSLIFGIIPCCNGIPALIFGIIGLNQTKRTGQKGRGLAIAGIVLGCIWLVVSVAVAIGLAIKDQPKRDESGHLTQSGDMDVTKLRVGDCIADLGEKSYYTTTKAIPCAQPHKAEVYAVVPLSGSSLPSQSVLDQKGNDECGAELETYAPNAFDDDAVQITYLYPTKRSWAQGDRAIACVATFTTERTASIKGK
ncbi:peptidylprolyl isomerase [Mycobacteroides franklinii]|nr:peptidylprolyl isomerase [Mycobacteroides franklinii]